MKRDNIPLSYILDDAEENEKGRKRKLEEEKESEELPDVDIPVKKQKKKKKENLRTNGIADTEEVTEVENEPEVKQNDGKKKKRKGSQKENGQDESIKQVTATPKMKIKSKRLKEKLDINGNSEDDIASKESIVKASNGLKEDEMISDQMSAQGKSSTSEMIVEKTIKELRNQVSPAQNTEKTPVKKKKKQELQGDETPFAAFTKTTTPPAFFRKAISRTEPRKSKTTKVLNPWQLSQNILNHIHY